MNKRFSGGYCSGGHGLSIGSVGGRDDNTVDTVTFKSSTVTNSQNGIRIKTKAGDTGTVSGVSYSDITRKYTQLGPRRYMPALFANLDTPSPLQSPPSPTTVSLSLRPTMVTRPPTVSPSPTSPSTAYPVLSTPTLTPPSTLTAPPAPTGLGLRLMSLVLTTTALASPLASPAKLFSSFQRERTMDYKRTYRPTRQTCSSTGRPTGAFSLLGACLAAGNLWFHDRPSSVYHLKPCT